MIEKLKKAYNTFDRSVPDFWKGCLVGAGITLGAFAYEMGPFNSQLPLNQNLFEAGYVGTGRVDIDATSGSDEVSGLATIVNIMGSDNKIHQYHLLNNEQGKPFLSDRQPGEIDLRTTVRSADNRDLVVQYQDGKPEVRFIPPRELTSPLYSDAEKSLVAAIHPKNSN